MPRRMSASGSLLDLRLDRSGTEARRVREDWPPIDPTRAVAPDQDNWLLDPPFIGRRWVTRRGRISWEWRIRKARSG